MSSLGGSVVERALGKGEVAGSIPAQGFYIWDRLPMQNYLNTGTYLEYVI